MRERERLLWSILIILLLILAGYEGYNAYRMGKQVRQYQEAMNKASLGSEDPQLRETVEELEADLQARLTYTFDIGRDPLDLSQVIYGRRLLASLGFSESPESQGKMRLSCTVVAQQPAAVIKFQGRSNIVRVGDNINGYRVSSIEAQQCLLVRGDERLMLATEKAFESIEEIERMSEENISVSTSEDTLAPDMNF